MTKAPSAEPTAIPAISLGDAMFRYREQSYSHTIDADRDIYGSTLRLDLDTYEVFKITQKGVWIARPWNIRKRPDEAPTLQEHGRKHFVLFSAKRRFAHASQVDALQAFIDRKARQARILEGQLARVAQAKLLGEAEMRKHLGTPSTNKGTLPVLTEALPA